jgi:hypothetical protein
VDERGMVIQRVLFVDEGGRMRIKKELVTYLQTVACLGS